MVVDFYKKDSKKKFFAYGVFMPNQVGYSLIKDYVCGGDDEIVVLKNYSLMHRNGMPMITRVQGSKTCGYLLEFCEDTARDAYNVISDSRSNSLYEWIELPIKSQRVNCLVSKAKRFGIPYYFDKYDGKHDLGFYDALNYIDRNLKSSNSILSDEESLFFIQMNYMMLWSIIDKYTSLRYGGWGQVENVIKLSKENAFRKSLRAQIENRERMEVFSSRSSEKCTLDLNQSKKYEKSAKYYYQLRCNITHGGKTRYEEGEKVKLALEDLSKVMRDVLDDAFGENDFI